MELYDEGKFGLTDQVADYVPILEKTDKARITVQDCAFHESGSTYWPFYEAVDTEVLQGGCSVRSPIKSSR